MKLISLSQGQFAQVDDEDYDFLMQWKWYAHKRRGNIYATRNSENKNGKRYTISMHRVIVKTPYGMETDHHDRNTLNNQKYNLRICTHEENMRNITKQKNTTSKYLGVSIHTGKYKNKIYLSWVAQMTINGKHKRLGTFKNEREAAQCYNESAKKHYGEFANLNIITAPLYSNRFDFFWLSRKHFIV